MAGEFSGGLIMLRAWKLKRNAQDDAGAWGEEAARIYLQKKGMQFVDRNFACRWGELDLIMKDKETLVVVEVRARSSAEYGLAHETVNYKKQQKIIKATKFYQQQKEWWGDVRFDVVAIKLEANGGREVEHVANAFYS